jgi:hypothetical protein
MAKDCSSSWSDEELLALEGMKIILHFDFLQYQNQVTITLTPIFVIVLSVLQDKLDHLTNCNFRGNLHLMFPF